MMHPIPVFYRPEQSSDAAASYSPSAGKPRLVVEDWMAHPVIGPNIRIEQFEPVTDEVLSLAHHPAYIDGLMDGSIKNGFGNSSPEIVASLRFTVGSMVAAARHAVASRSIAVSPTSGFHHARYASGGGFCTVNGLVIAALEMRRHGLVKNVLIIDGDAHYGDGTESCIKSTNSGHWIQNITAQKSYKSVKDFFRCIDVKHLIANHDERMWEDIGSTLCIYQAGADAWKQDPLGEGLFTLPELARRDARIFGLAKYYNVPLVWNLAGGYSRDEKGTIEPVLALHRQTMVECVQSYLGK